MNTTNRLLNILVKISILFLTIALFSSYFLLNSNKNSIEMALDGYTLGQGLLYTIMSLPSFLSFILLFKKSSYEYIFSSALIVGILLETIIFRLSFSSITAISRVDVINMFLLLLVLSAIGFLNFCEYSKRTSNHTHKKRQNP